MALVINLFGGPGCGKSTLAAGVFYHLKRQGVNCEFVHEFAKGLAWEQRMGALQDQLYILGNQVRLMNRCMDDVDVIVTDTSILYGVVYSRQHPTDYQDDFEQVVIAAFNSMNNMNIWVNRAYPYDPIGRYQDEDGAHELDRDIHALLLTQNIPFMTVNGNDQGVDMVLGAIRRDHGTA